MGKGLVSGKDSRAGKWSLPRTACLLFLCLAWQGCASLQAGNAPQSSADGASVTAVRGSVIRKDASLLWRVPAYVAVGFPRDVADAPFTFIYNNRDKSEIAGFLVGGVAGVVGEAYAAWFLATSGEFWGLPSIVGGFAVGGAVGCGSVYAVESLMPLETVLFRYPADGNVFGYSEKGLFVKKVGEEPVIPATVAYHFDEYPLVYLPNFHGLLYHPSPEDEGQ